MSASAPDAPGVPGTLAATSVSRPGELAATLTLASAAARTWDALVVGAGPAGALVAGLLARDGLAVLLVDRARFPRGKVCGCCLNARALDALERAGLGDLPAALGARPLQHMELAAQGRRVRLPLPGGVSISREALDAALVTAACERGAHFLPGAFAAGTGAPAPGAPRAVDMTRIDGPEGTARLHARVVLVADGLGGRLLDADELGPATIARDSRLGAGTVLAHAPEAVAPGTLWMACGAAGYVGLVRLQDDRLDVAAAFEARALAAAGGARGAGALAASLLAGAGLHELAELPLAGAMWRGTPQLTRTPARRGARAALLLGDACGYVEPFTGEGIASALGSALAVLPFAEAAARGWDDALLPAWERCWTRTIGARQRSTRALAWLLRHPRLLAPCMTVLALRPALAAPLLAGLAAPTRVTPPARATDPATRDDAVAPARRSASARAPR